MKAPVITMAYFWGACKLYAETEIQYCAGSGVDQMMRSTLSFLFFNFLGGHAPDPDDDEERCSRLRSRSFTRLPEAVMSDTGSVHDIVTLRSF